MNDELKARSAATSALGLLHPTLVDVEVVEDTGITVTRSGQYTYDVSFPDGYLFEQAFTPTYTAGLTWVEEKRTELALVVRQ